MISSTADKEMIRAAQEEICNTAVNLMWMYQNSDVKDIKVKQTIKRYIQIYLKKYCGSKQHGTGRKIQAILAGYAPRLYTCLKNRVTKGI